jgi:sugar lactone lactonase YvrE
VIFTASVTSGDTNTVTFYCNGSSIGTATPSNGAATLTTSSLPAGSDSITASVASGGNYTSASSSAITQIVNQAAQTIIFTAPTSPLNYGKSPITLQATASSGLPITFSAAGPATASGSTLTVTGTGTVTVTASQAGNANYLAAVPISYVIVNGFVLPGSGVISTVAGNPGSGDDLCSKVLATSEYLEPMGVAVDTAGNIYVAEESYGIVCKVNVATNTISRVAGTGTRTYSGDKGSAISAGLVGPTGVAVDASGNVYIADADGNRVRMVAGVTSSSYTQGDIYTLAGKGTAGYGGDVGPATSATLNAPRGVAVDSTGNIYIADSGNNRVRMVSINFPISEGLESPTNAVPYIFTVAGTGTYGYSLYPRADYAVAGYSELAGPGAVAVSGAYVYVADTDNDIVRRFGVSLGGASFLNLQPITTVAGGGSAECLGEANLIGDNGPASSATLCGPWGVAVDSSGNLYIADTGDKRIRMVAGVTNSSYTQGDIYTVGGTGGSGFSGDGGLAVNAELDNPYGVAVDTRGNIYIADTGNGRIRVVGVAPTVAVSCSPNPITYGGANSVCTVSVGSGATGTVSLAYNGTPWTTLTLNPSGTATATWSSTTGVGTYTIAAAYSGDATHSPSNGQTVLTVNQVTTTVSLNSSVNPMPSGSSTIFTATIVGGVNPSGTVTFQTNLNKLGTVTVSGGTAVYSANNVSWPAGTYTISAIYSGDAVNTGATGTTVETVYSGPSGPPGAPGTLLAPGFGPPGSSLTITGSGFGSTPGSVTFGATQAVVSNWNSQGTSITVQVPTTLAAGLYQVAVNGTNVGQSLFLVTPTVTSLSLTSGPPTIGLVISGSGFGATQGDSYVTIGSPSSPVTAPVVPTSTTNPTPLWSDNAITIQVPKGMPQGSWYITVNVAYGPIPYSIAPTIPQSFAVTCTFLNDCNPTPP